MSKPRSSFKTNKGLELPLLNLRNKEYLQVMHRIQWFRSENPSGIIKTTMIEKNGEGPNEYAVFKAEVYVDSERGPMMIANAHKKETRAGFDDFIEKSETGAIGRALALCGYGTVFAADDLDEGDRLADAPAPVLEKTETVTTATNGAGRRPSFRKNISVVTEKNTVAPGDDI